MMVVLVHSFPCFNLHITGYVLTHPHLENCMVVIGVVVIPRELERLGMSKQMSVRNCV